MQFAWSSVCLEQRRSQTDSHGKLLKGAWVRLLSRAESAGLSESCKEQYCHINTSAQGPGPSQARSDSFRWTYCHSQWSAVVQSPYIDLLEMTEGSK